MGDEVARSEGRKIEPRTVVAIVVGLIVVLLVAQNLNRPAFKFLFFSIPVWFALGVTALIMLAVGFVLGRRSRGAG